ncbi:hypothetical protein SAMN04487949_3504 [Halogranum gelatinilyticum]|uniref:PD-(D/E)XK nuclease-like domain-containing protein n=1 Tax=Halogranum gelatinilyticum TaxID=660521 RepID=A0A1G9Z316_9EURY|nr:hypothetical protein [Halogranum gelatinilyticum]SDN15161.1 hypothetical protein SAMN04487949_3504 [Halogranum gelatinilyticum]
MSKIELTDDWARTLSSNRKGDFGEAIAKTHIQSVVEECPHELFPEYGDIDSSLYTQARHRHHFTFREADESGKIERIQWQADLTIKLINIYEDSAPEMERNVALEVKTGQYAKLERDQKKVMGILNEDEETLVLRANVRLDGDSIAEIQYSTLKPDASTKAGYRLIPFNL